jgi:hypothetical protein
MDEHEESISIIDAGEDDLSEKIRESGNGIILFFATWDQYSKKSLRILPKLAAEYKGKLRFIRVEMSAEDDYGGVRMTNPRIRNIIGIERYPKWGIFQNGFLNTSSLVLSAKDENGQLLDVQKLIHELSVE